MKKWYWFVIALLVVIIDQTTKYWAFLYLIPYQPMAVIPMFNLTLVYNTGAAFSFLSQAGDWHRWFFTGFSLIMSIVLSIWIFRLPMKAKLQQLALSLILGGAVGNLIDRAFFGFVVDFIDVYYKNHHWPVFNMADSAICIGAFLLLIEMMPSLLQRDKS